MDKLDRGEALKVLATKAEKLVAYATGRYRGTWRVRRIDPAHWREAAQVEAEVKDDGDLVVRLVGRVRPGTETILFTYRRKVVESIPVHADRKPYTLVDVRLGLYTEHDCYSQKAYTPPGYGGHRKR